jgi:hypothetical protein
MAEIVGEWPAGQKRVVLVTGGAGFIGSHTSLALLGRGDDVIVVDEVNDYYDISIKEDNLALLSAFARTYVASPPPRPPRPRHLPHHVTQVSYCCVATQRVTHTHCWLTSTSMMMMTLMVTMTTTGKRRAAG